MITEANLEELSFEELLKMLEETIGQLDGNTLTLEESIETYERSVSISAACEKILNEAELRITRIDTRKPSTIGEELDDDDEYDV